MIVEKKLVTRTLCWAQIQYKNVCGTSYILRSKWNDPQLYKKNRVIQLVKRCTQYNTEMMVEICMWHKLHIRTKWNDP